MQRPTTKLFLQQTGFPLAEMSMPLLQPTVAPKNSSATKGIYLEMRKLIHDLKLPLTLVNGELEAIEDGVRAWTPETTRTLLSELEQIKSMLEAISLSSRLRQPLTRPQRFLAC
ncbi:hypothetical protein KHX94_06715 [Shewanella dokdonensis]|uniref:Signal transduction histidine kinase dimerisation/phosphoacceptor domain-containing protein n=1 Tax=Shewanella dokdonensis TaxID=712036 RepID=A0ABX8DHK2_9GAMM|nr:hypothetical protein [Shewanella dokdonensis]QVK24239.1 hypothetical protein KHX94_06715 [Shewanella dokdonensis]